MQYKQSNSRKTSIATAKLAQQQAEEESKQAKLNLLKSINDIYGQEAVTRINTGTIWVGMPVLLLPIAAGKAQDIKESLYKNAKTEKWYYGQHANRLGNIKYSLEVIVENGVVVGWKDLQ